MFLVNIKIKYQFDLRAGAIPVLFYIQEAELIYIEFGKRVNYF